MVLNVAALICYCIELLLKHFWISFWWNIDCALYWRELIKNKFLDFYNCDHLDMHIFLFGICDSKSKEKD